MPDGFIMIELADIGFSKGIILETIVSTYDSNGQPNAAPMGVMAKDERSLVIRPYVTSLTYMNLKLRRFAVINVTFDPELYYFTAFKEANPNGRVPLEWFEEAEVVNAPRLKMAHAFIEVSVTEIKPLEVYKAEALCEAKLIKTSRVLPKAYCRALFATIESIIHATRIKALLTSSERDRAQIQRLMSLIEHYNALVKRIAPNSRHSEIMTNLIRMINSWGINK